MRKKTAVPPFRDDPLWYKDAIIYELHVRSFFDSNADGIGDFAGLIQKLDYLEDLGVNTLWLLPFYPSPLKDEGYDISDYYNINPVYGQMADFETFLGEAHRHGLRVITELVINHTSNRHPWFQKARGSAPGSRARDFYVWNSNRDKYKGVRIIFKDTEYSNWTWDEMAQAYYWHRFYSHQPDLNFDNPAVRKAIFKVVDFWLGMGVDGLRVDAVPYLYEREGTSCENLPESHAFLKELRAYIDKKYKNRIILAEANQWPEDAVPYFGKGDEFHMAFHFPIMPRLFMSIGMEDRFPIVDILRQTPPIPENCQWAIFLRNHDELTLEMVTDEERDYMYRVYASDPNARLNLGIRRRLAPLLNNDRRKLEMINALLFSLPGTPVIYYGDEIAMGDNIYLGDRNGVRTPMQWSADRNAGFSHANPQQLYLPTITDPGYHFEAVNVETQQANPDSFLSWMNRIITLNKRYKAFGRGSIEFIQPENHKILAFLRRYQDETILVVANLSHLGQQTQLDLKEYTGYRLINVFGPVEFTPVTESKYPFTLSPYAYYWFSLQPRQAEPVQLKTLPAEEIARVPTIVKAADELFENENLASMETLLQNYLKGRRWFRSKARDIQSSQIKDVIPTRSPECTAYFVLIQVNYVEGEPETYVVPLSIASAERMREIRSEHPQAIVARLQAPDGSNESLLCDAMLDKKFCKFLLQSIDKRHRFRGETGQIVASSTQAFSNALSPGEAVPEPTPVKAEQTNTSIVYGDKLIFKLFRQLGEGINPELEIGRFLTEKTAFTNVPPLVGALEYYQTNAKPISLAVLHGFVPSEGDAWRYTQDSLERYFQYVLAQPVKSKPPLPQEHLVSLSKELPPLAREAIGPYLVSTQLLGQRTAELHMALASVPDDPDFAPEPFTFVYQTSLYQSMRIQTVRTLQVLREKLAGLPEDVGGTARKVCELEKPIIERYRLIQHQNIPAVRIRYHGDYHLGQILYTGKDFIIIDFEGETARPLSERRLKRSPLRDVAGMIRSFHYAAESALLRQVSLAPRPGDELSLLQNWAQYWYTWVSVTFLAAYLDSIRVLNLLPEDTGQLRILLDAFLLEKAVYEIGYELNNRPAWLKIPLQGVLQLMETGA
ncbi:MAG: maltose alpha-D-glucosyltransferase [Chloroflexi bacterium RBG_16_56_11]|nr:MAG: maltose alpha-D-glucosyltransferase [Chloroflexi bacterium RBG_16_56_11]